MQEGRWQSSLSTWRRNSTAIKVKSRVFRNNSRFAHSNGFRWNEDVLSALPSLPRAFASKGLNNSGELMPVQNMPNDHGAEYAGG